jgi:transposase
MDMQTLLGLPDVAVSGIDLTTDRITLDIAPTAAQACCPHCQQPSAHVHSYYTRSVSDLALGGRLVVLRLRVRRFRCLTQTCSARTFTEQCPRLVAQRCRRTRRVQQLLSQLALTVGGEGGARLAVPLQVPASAATLRRCLRALPLPEIVTPKILGVDDFAWRKGQSYGTILVDLSTHRPIDLLPDRSADSFANWLEAHPGVEVISRDRAGAYADGATRGAPDAEQVADRFHLLQNLREVTERLLDREMNLIRTAQASASQATSEVASEPKTVQSPSTITTDSQTLRASAARASRRQERFAAVQELRAQGASIHRIVHQLGVSRNTVRKYLRTTECPPSAARPRRPSLLDPFSIYLTNRWVAGCTNSAQLYRELKAQGFAGSESIVRDWARQRRVPKGSAAPRSQERRPASARSISWLLVREEATLAEEERADLAVLKEHSPVIASAYPLIQAFGTMIRERQTDHLEQWLSTVEKSQQVDFQAFALGLRRDQKAVANALKLEWSNGPTEGAITRLKLIKRTGYGRASFETLRRRVLLAA